MSIEILASKLPGVMGTYGRLSYTVLSCIVSCVQKTRLFTFFEWLTPFSRKLQVSVLWHAYADLGNFTPSAYTTVCNATCGRSSMLTVGSPELFAETLGAVDIRRASIRRINTTAWNVKFIVGVETETDATAMIDFDDGTRSPVTLGNVSLVSDYVPYPDSWRVGEVKHTYRRPRNYSVSLTIGSRVNKRWTVQSNVQVCPVCTHFLLC